MDDNNKIITEINQELLCFSHKVFYIYPALPRRKEMIDYSEMLILLNATNISEVLSFLYDTVSHDELCRFPWKFTVYSLNDLEKVEVVYDFKLKEDDGILFEIDDKHSCENPLNYYDLNTVECDCQIIPKVKPGFICIRTEI